MYRSSGSKLGPFFGNISIKLLALFAGEALGCVKEMRKVALGATPLLLVASVRGILDGPRVRKGLRRALNERDRARHAVFSLHGRAHALGIDSNGGV